MIHHSSLNPQITKFTPIGEQVLLRRHQRPDKIGAIILPSNARFVDLAKFDVLAVGPKCESVKPGDIALAPCQIGFVSFDLAGEKVEVAQEKLLSAVIPQ
jgi:co-chaperonin GroES (HSP10)